LLWHNSHSYIGVVKGDSTISTMNTFNISLITYLPGYSFQ